MEKMVEVERATQDELRQDLKSLFQGAIRVTLEYVHRLRIPRPVAPGEHFAGLHSLGPARCVDHGPEKILRLALPHRQLEVSRRR